MNAAQLPTTAWEPMHEHISHVEPQKEDVWHIKHIRDFIYTPEMPPVYRWSEKNICLNEVVAAHFYMIPIEQFGKMGRMFAHTCLGFSFTDGTDLLYSIEVRQPAGKEYRPSSDAENVRIFATLKYFRGFRHVVRKRGFSRYPILLSRTEISALLKACLEDSHNNYGIFNHYHAVTNQCTTALLNAMNRALEKPIPWHPGWHLTGLTHRAIAAQGLINLADREIL